MDAMSWLNKGETPKGDKETLTRLRRGDRGALSVLFRRHMPIVYGAAYVVTGSQADAEEAAQDAFFLLWQKRAELTIVGESVLPWLITTARHHASNRRRRASVRQTVPLLEERDTSPVGDGETAAIAAELQQRLTTAIARLSPVDQNLVHACLVENMTYAEAALALGVTHGALRNRLSRAKSQLRSQLASERNQS
jgi:RNA polymerase sigma factor (sigma-70 family)